MRVSKQTTDVDPRYHVEAAARTIQLLEAVASSSPATIASLTTQLGWTKPMVYRLVRTLHGCGALRLSEDGYSLGPVMISLGYAALQSVRLVDAARSTLEQVHEQTGESVVLTVLDGTDMVYVDFIQADHLLVLNARLGTRLPAYATSSGQALLSRHSTAKLRSLFEDYSFDARTSHSITSLKELEQRLEEVRRDGYALMDEELVLGHRSVAAPVVDHRGAVAAAISISVPAARVSVTALRRLARDILAPAAEKLSVDLGAPVDM